MTERAQKHLGEWVKKLRDEKGFTQEEAARHLNVKRQAIGQMEKGERGVDGLEARKLAELFSVSVDFLLNVPSKGGASQGNKGGTKSTPRVKFKLESERLKSVILYILEKCGGKPNLGETVLYKLLYFVDFDAYEILGKPVTGMNYVKLQFGPAPKIKDFQSVVNEMMKKKELTMVHQDYHGKIQKRYIAFSEPDMSAFSAEEKQVMDKVLSRLSDMRAVEIEAYAHGDAPWRLTGDGEVIDPVLVFERTVPYAHRDYDELMQDAAGYDALKDLGEITKAEIDYYMNLK